MNLLFAPLPRLARLGPDATLVAVTDTLEICLCDKGIMSWFIEFYFVGVNLGTFAESTLEALFRWAWRIRSVGTGAPSPPSAFLRAKQLSWLTFTKFCE